MILLQWGEQLGGRDTLLAKQIKKGIVLSGLFFEATEENNELSSFLLVDHTLPLCLSPA